MGMEQFSKNLPSFSGEIENPALQSTLKSLEEITGKEIIKLEWDNERVAAPIEVQVDLPSLGNIDGLDIRETEPVILVFDIVNYPISAPKVFTDRLDFPKNQLAHLYIAVNDRPPGFCFVRGNVNEWYANKRIEDLIVRISNWLRDAAIGELTEDGEQFDPLRLEGYSGTIIYDYDTILNAIFRKTTHISRKHLAVALFERPNQTGRCTYKLVKLLTSGNALETIKDVDEERKKDQKDITQKNYHYGYLIWGEEGVVSKDYYVNLPRNWEEFKSFCNFYGVDYRELENFIATCDPNSFIHFPVIVGIRRPRPIIGYSSDIEFINFRFWVNSDDVKDGAIINNISVDFFSHNQPLTRKQASQISDCEIDFSIRTGVFGCGALGSKVIMHMARAGHTNLTLIDPDHISPHNLVRHTLFGEDEGENKAVALAERIKTMYPHQKNSIFSLKGLPKGLMDKEDLFAIHNWILDFTASEAFFNQLSLATSINKSNVVSALISDFGNLGILYKEGESRNPRVDDLQVFLYSLSIDDKKISEWLKREQQAKNDNNVTVRVGIGCNSETTILSDDKISTHASYFSGILKREISNTSIGGKIYLSRIDDSLDYSIETQTITVSPFEVMIAVNDPSWMIRFQSEVVQKVKKEFSAGGRIEAGGVFLGICNYKTKTIHILKSISAPQDSKASSAHFIRGHSGLPEEINNFKNISGDQIGYIGEWHSHPEGPNILSKQDMESVYKHKAEFELLRPPLPVFLTIITPDGLFPFVF